MNAALKWILLVTLSLGLVLAIGCSWAPDEEDEEVSDPIGYEEPEEQSDPASLPPEEQENL
ncbi:hypothetical protein GF324_03860, partial [bacterium]|nr:hypothetical protein [bacterium]